tara:strand:+ start:815 stop:2086 length:1272 start_codon:yes stop_codon:yes gene_type:complete
MTINQGLSSLVNSSPNFSNQSLENAINDIKTKVNRDWVTKTFTLDTAIDNNTVLTTTQKNDVKETINTFPHLNIGRYLNDTIKHTNTILDGTIIPIPAGETQTATFLETLNLVESLQSTIPMLYGVTAEEKSRGVDDHFGTLRGVLSETEDSSKPVLESITEQLQALNRQNLLAIAEDGEMEDDLDDLINFLSSVVGDSTDFQQTLDKFVLQVKLSFQGINQFLLNLGIYGSHTDIQAIGTQLEADYEKVTVQVALEYSNLYNIRTYTNTLTDNLGYTSLAENSKLADLIVKTSRTSAWQDYFQNYATRKSNINPVYTVGTDSDKITIIERVMLNRGLPDVTDYVNLDAVADKSKKDSRIDTKDFENKTSEQIITTACDQLGITTANRSIYNQSKELLNNMNDYDKQQISDELDANQTTDTIT